MKKPIFQDLLEHQRTVATFISYPIAAMFLIMLGVLYFGLGVTTILPNAMLVYILLIALNILIFKLHKNLFVNYLTIVTLSLAWFAFMALKTGGILSPFAAAFLLLPIGAFITSRKQGRIWSVITLIVLLALYLNDYWVENILANDAPSQRLFSFITYLCVLVIAALLSLFAKSSSYQMHHAYHSAASELSKKSHRLEMLANMLNYSTDLMCIIDIPSLKIEDLNPIFRTILGYEMEELTGKSFLEIVVKDETTATLDRDLISIKNNQTIEFDCHMKCKNGSTLAFNWVGIFKEAKLYASARKISDR